MSANAVSHHELHHSRGRDHGDLAHLGFQPGDLVVADRRSSGSSCGFGIGDLGFGRL
jgi:hypothetical protein